MKTNGIDSQFLGFPDHCLIILMIGHHIDPVTRHQSVHRFPFLLRILPAVREHHIHHSLGINLPYPQGKGIDTTVDLLIAHGCNIADMSGLCLASCNQAGHIPCLIHFNRKRSQVIRIIITGIGIKGNIRIILHDLIGLFGIVVAGEDNDRYTLLRKTTDCCNDIRIVLFYIFFEKEPGICSFCRIPDPFVIGGIPAIRISSADHNESNLQLIRGAVMVVIAAKGHKEDSKGRHNHGKHQNMPVTNQEIFIDLHL